jgi:hypothetical protein
VIEKRGGRMKTKLVVSDWVSRKWHKSHKWHAGTGKFIKKMLNKKTRVDTKLDLNN